MVQYKLYYFNLLGRAELSRLILAAAGQEYEDVRIERENWPKLKESTPFGKMPLLEVHDGSNVFKLSQSIAIGKFNYFKPSKICIYLKFKISSISCKKIQFNRQQ